MKYHINCCFIELWRVIEDSFNPRELKNLLPRELVDMQLNASALQIILLSLSEKDKALVRTLTTAKETWDTLMEHINCSKIPRDFHLNFDVLHEC
jgi:hypothetical protein